MESDDGDNRPAHARCLRWGDSKAVEDLKQELETGEFDLVIGSDLIYQEDVSFKACLSSRFCVERSR